MKILIAGKGGTGKTTITSILSFILSRAGYKVLVLDTDSVPNTAISMGIPPSEASKIIPLVMNEELVEERTGARPGEGWGVFFTLNPRVDDIVDRYGVRISNNLSLVVVGSIDASKQGCLCPAIALARQFLRHVFTSRDEIIIVDSEAGAEVFGRGLAEYFDLMMCISEPTYKSLAISRKLVKLASELMVKENAIIVNKVRNIPLAKLLCEKMLNDEIPYYIVRYDKLLEDLEYEGRGLNELPDTSIVYSDVKSIVRNLMPWIKV